jgi:hypothetical protein
MTENRFVLLVAFGGSLSRTSKIAGLDQRGDIKARMISAEKQVQDCNQG